MQVNVLYFGILKELYKRDVERIELSAEATVGALLEVVRTARPTAGEVWQSLAVAVNQEYAAAGKVLQDGDEVALLPPVSGGVGWADED